jgi:hypothetical protein
LWDFGELHVLAGGIRSRPRSIVSCTSGGSKRHAGGLRLASILARYGEGRYQKEALVPRAWGEGFLVAQTENAPKKNRQKSGVLAPKIPYEISSRKWGVLWRFDGAGLRV